MKLATKTIKGLAKLVTGDANLTPYKSGPALVEFFNAYGGNDVYPRGGGFPSRWQYAETKLFELNGNTAMRSLICQILDPREYIDTDRDPNSAAEYLNRYLKFDGFEVIREGDRFKIRSLTGQDVALEVPYAEPTELTHFLIDEHVQKCQKKIDEEDYSGAITNARALAESVLINIESELNPTAGDYNGDLVQLFRRVQRLLNLDPSRKDISESLKQVLSGLNSIVNGLAAMRNKMSDSHAATYRADRHHAKLAVNAAKTLCDFLFETKTYQQKRGALKPPAIEGVK
jgi:abortive infection Abi-like protein